MSKKTVDISNFAKAIENQMISISRVEVEAKYSTYITEKNLVKPEMFVESLQLLNKSLFKDAIEFTYGFKGDYIVVIECEISNLCGKEHYHITCIINDGISAQDVNKQFRETIFDRMEVKSAMSV